MTIKQVTIIGTGLIGGSLGLSLRSAGLGIRVVGCDRDHILERARSVFGDQVSRRFLGGHPMAGKEHGSIFSAEPALFRDTTWLLVPPNPRQPLENERVKEYRQLLEILGAHIMQIEAERHD